MPVLSIVLPVYNVEKYLAACLESVRAQTFRDIEIVCVDDGSTDRSRHILDMVAAVDPRIVVVSKQNGGLSSARNAGLAAATGTYVWFVDSDDFVHNKAAARVVAEFRRTDADIVTFGAFIHPAAHATRWLNRTLSPRKGVFEGFSEELLFEEASRPFVWRSAFSREFLLREGLRFDESVVFGEDQVFYFSAYPVARRTALLADKLYYYRAARPDSLMASRFENRKAMLREHHHIARVILTEWAGRGWLDGREGPVLGWLLEFLAGDAVVSPAPLGPSLRASLAAMLGEFLPRGAWLQAQPALTRRLYDRLTVPSANVSRRVALRSWQAAHQPVPTVLGALGRVAHSWPALKAKGVSRRVLPATGHTQWKWIRDLSDDITDDARRREALHLLQIEWLGRGEHSPDVSASE